MRKLRLVNSPSLVGHQNVHHTYSKELFLALSVMPTNYSVRVTFLRRLLTCTFLREAASFWHSLSLSELSFSPPNTPRFWELMMLLAS